MHKVDDSLLPKDWFEVDGRNPLKMVVRKSLSAQSPPRSSITLDVRLLQPKSEFITSSGRSEKQEIKRKGVCYEAHR